MPEYIIKAVLRRKDAGYNVETIHDEEVHEFEARDDHEAVVYCRKYVEQTRLMIIVND